jgi:hypothetical protein
VYAAFEHPVKVAFRKFLLWAHLLAVGSHFLCASFGASFNTPAEPRISLVRSDTGVVQVNYEGQTNFQYIIRASTNLPVWFNLATNIATNAATSFITDNAATNSSQRFYSAAALKSPMFYYGTTAGGEACIFILYVRTNNLGTLFALNNTRNIGERVQNMQFDANGNYSGPLYSHASCALSLSNNILAGRYTNTASLTGSITGTNRNNYGFFRTAAGLYSGTFGAGTSCAGSTIQGLLSADGFLVFYITNAAGSYTDAWTGQANANTGSFASAQIPPVTVHLSGTVSVFSATISGSYIHGCPDRAGAGSVSLARSEKAY